MPGPQIAHDQEFGMQDSPDKGEVPDMLEAKLWANPCPFTFRVNYLALLYNTPLYSWVNEQYGLTRPEYVVLYSLALANGGSARDVSSTSGFPKNTLSRAINRLERLGLIKARSKARGGRRRQALHLSDEGWALMDETRPAFEAQEKRMLKVLTQGERLMLFEILSKVVMDAQEWAGDLPPEAGAKKKGTKQ